MNQQEQKQNDVMYQPAITQAGVQWKKMVAEAREAGIKGKFSIPRQFVIPTVSFKKNKPKKKKEKVVFKRSDIKGRGKKRKCTT